MNIVPGFIKKSLRLKLVLASVIIELIMLSLLLGNSLRIINNTIDQQSTIQAESIAPLLDSALSIPLFERDLATLSELLKKLIQQQNGEFSYIKIYDDRANLYTEMKKQAGESAGEEISTENILHLSTPLTLSGEEIGSIAYGLSVQTLYDSKSTLMQQSLAIAAIEIVLTIILLGTIGYFLTRHISVLLQGAEDVSAGFYDTKIQVESQDEIGLLADKFNFMARAVLERITEISESSHALSIKTAEFESIFNSISEGVIFENPDRVCININPAMLVMFAYPREKFLNQKLDFLYQSQDDFDHQCQSGQEKSSPGKSDSYEISFVRSDGSVFIGELTSSPVHDDEGSHLGFTSILRDISERKQNEFDLMEAKEKALVTLESIGDAVITTDEKGLVQYLNPVAEELTGWSNADAQARPLQEVFDIYNEKTSKPIENPVKRCLRENTVIGLANHTVLINRHGKKYAIEDSAAPIKDKQGNILGVILVFHDVSKARKLAGELSWQASHDSLTGLANRLEFEVRLKATLNKDDIDSHHALLYMDLDQFKVVNDTCGHVAGDELLKQLAGLFQKHVRDNDVLARLGGDEFGVFLENCPTENAHKIAETIIEDLGQFRFSWQDQVFNIGISIGLVPFNLSDNETISSLMSEADVACYAAKDAGRNRVHVYKKDDKALVQRHSEMQWVSQIQLALEENKFELYCQPIVSTSRQNKEPEQYEILIRLQSPDGALIMPMSFLPAAERYNLMPDIDRWVISQVLKQLKQFPLDERCLITINLSGAPLSDDKFLEFVVDQLDEESVNAEQFCFEITETAAISNLGNVTTFIATLQKLGCQFSLDDFGSGLSSFSYLKNLNVNYLKIDGAFVRDMTRDPVDRGMVEAINKIGHVMSIKTIAEFVENQATLDILVEIGIDYAQGYYFSKPTTTCMYILRIC